MCGSQDRPKLEVILQMVTDFSVTIFYTSVVTTVREFPQANSMVRHVEVLLGEM